MNQKYIGYCRVSTDRQGESRLGLEAQQEAVRTYVSGAGGTLLAEHIEVESGKRSNRPVLADAIEACRRERAVLVIAKLDRLSRSVAFTAALLDSGVEFKACDMPEANRFMVHVMAAFAEHEREMISARTKAALTAAKARGVILGSYGKTLAARNAAQAQDFAEAHREQIEGLLANGCARLQDVADGLNAVGTLTREGSKWGAASVQRLIRRLDLRTLAMTNLRAA